MVHKIDISCQQKNYTKVVYPEKNLMLVLLPEKFKGITTLKNSMSHGIFCS